MKKDLFLKFYQSDIISKRCLIRQILTEKNIVFFEHSFVSCFGIGCNFIVMPKTNHEHSILISAHYDGMGIYDNCGGVLQLFDLIINEKESNRSIVFIFTDQEKCYQQGMYHFTKSSFFLKPKFHLNIDGTGVGNKLIVMPYEIFKATTILHGKSLVTDNRITFYMGIASFQSFSLDGDDFVFKNGEIYFQKSLNSYLDEDWLLSKSVFCVGNYCITDKFSMCIDDILKNKYTSTWIY
jgi:hypothetical protein